LRLNQLIRVKILEVQLFGDDPAHGSLARAHETDERDVDEMAIVVHGDKVTQTSSL
jgi:uncharacterized Zn-binding protein involved in type VI secretion